MKREEVLENTVEVEVFITLAEGLVAVSATGEMKIQMKALSHRA